jgi:predicted DNA-binding ribbon-helix-helix protein
VAFLEQLEQGVLYSSRSTTVMQTMSSIDRSVLKTHKSHGVTNLSRSIRVSIMVWDEDTRRNATLPRR